MKNRPRTCAADRQLDEPSSIDAEGVDVLAVDESVLALFQGSYGRKSILCQCFASRCALTYSQLRFVRDDHVVVISHRVPPRAGFKSYMNSTARLFINGQARKC